MDFLKNIGKITGELGGMVLGAPAKVAGELTGSQLLKDVGTGVQHATESAGIIMGEAASGSVELAAGIVSLNEDQVEQGLSDIRDAAEETVRGVEQVVNSVTNRMK